jgi:hypothetical protein
LKYWKSVFLGSFFLIAFASCYKNHLYVQQEWVDPNFLASSKVNTPDPRREHPPVGQRLLVAWDFPLSQFRRQLSLIATIRFWDDTEKILTQPLERKRDFAAFYFPNNCPESDRRILTYRVQIVDREGCVVETWEHHFWTQLIDFDPPSK